MKKKIFFTQEQFDEMVQMHDNGYLNREIAERFNVSLATINRTLADLGVESRHPRLTEDRISKAIALYSVHKNLTVVSKELKMSTWTISKVLKDRGIKVLSGGEVNSTRTINECFFDVIDTHEKAYFLGLIAADGTVGKSRSTVALSLQEGDRHIIEEFKKALECDYKVSIIEVSKRSPNRKNLCQISITNWHLREALIKHGVVPQKTMYLKFSNMLDEEFYPSFILGYMDGNGTICKGEKRCSLVSTCDFCMSLKEIIEGKFGIHCQISYLHKKYDKPQRVLRISGGKQVKTFLDWIYSKSDHRLERKYKIYKEKYC